MKICTTLVSSAEERTGKERRGEDKVCVPKCIRHTRATQQAPKFEINTTPSLPPPSLPTSPKAETAHIYKLKNYSTQQSAPLSSQSHLTSSIGGAIGARGTRPLPANPPPATPPPPMVFSTAIASVLTSAPPPPNPKPPPPSCVSCTKSGQDLKVRFSEPGSKIKIGFK